MQLWLLIGAAAIVAVAGAWWLLGSRDDAMVRRDLPGFGQVDVPRRLEGRQPDVSPRISVFRFDLIAGGFAFMGSITPVRERLVVVAWDRASGDRAGAIGEARDLVAERVDGLRWRVEGDVARRGDLCRQHARAALAADAAGRRVRGDRGRPSHMGRGLAAGRVGRAGAPDRGIVPARSAAGAALALSDRGRWPSSSIISSPEAGCVCRGRWWTP